MKGTSKHRESAPLSVHGQRRPIRQADPSALIRLFENWMQGDAVEQRETFESLREALDEGRPAEYKLFS